MTASRALGHPISLLAIAALVVNDHVLKAAYPGVVTGKLSDVAGMMFFPLLLAAIAELARVRRGVATVVVTSALTGLGLAAIKLSVVGGDAFRVGLAMLQWPFQALRTLATGEALPALGRVSLVADPTDLVALVALVVPIALALRSQRLGEVDRSLAGHVRAVVEPVHAA